MGFMATELTPPVPRLSARLSPEGRRRLERLARKASEAEAERNRAIVEEHAAGVSLRAIAEAVGLSHMGVSKIVRRSEESGEDA